MTSEFNIKAYCHIRNRTFSVNGSKQFKYDVSDLSVFFKSGYKSLDLDYPKFFKMDSLSKLALLGSELIFKTNQNNTIDSNTAIVLSNKASSLDSDRKFQESISDRDQFYPSPAVFVYTLPNICIGEISIRQQFRSENSFFIFERFNPEPLFVHANDLLQSNKASNVLCGWVNVDADEYDCFMYLVSKNGIFAHSIEQINSLYNAQ